MIGDWVYSASMTPRKVQYLDGAKSDSIGVVDCLNFESAISPIPLTAKILEKNGFYNAKRDTDGMLCAAIYRHEKGLVWHHYDKDYVRITNYGDNFQWYTQVSCKYVHELQHALRLCGLNELADNFQID